MRLDKFTIKAQEALHAAHNLADEKGHQAVEPEHLLAVLVSQPDGLVPAILTRIGFSPVEANTKAGKAVAKLPRVTGADGGYISQRLKKALEAAAKEAAGMRDEFISVEHLLIALADQAEGDPGEDKPDGEQLELV